MYYCKVKIMSVAHIMKDGVRVVLMTTWVKLLSHAPSALKTSPWLSLDACYPFSDFIGIVLFEILLCLSIMS